MLGRYPMLRRGQGRRAAIAPFSNARSPVRDCCGRTTFLAIIRRTMQAGGRHARSRHHSPVCIVPPVWRNGIGWAAIKAMREHMAFIISLRQRWDLIGAAMTGCHDARRPVQTNEMAGRGGIDEAMTTAPYQGIVARRPVSVITIFGILQRPILGCA